MIIFPAIDLKDGQCVRLKKGDMEQATIFNDNPANQAKQFEDEGFEWIHIVDLNGAFEGKPVNGDAVDSIIKAVNVPVQLGGGIRNLETIEHWLGAGVSRVILGTVALRDPELVKKACSLFPGKIAVGIDAKGGKVAVQGWAEDSTVDVETLSLKFEDAGVSCIIYTDINRDGILAGPDIEGTKKLASAITTPVIASGGISSLDDIVALKELESLGVIGAITGRAIYDGKFSSEDVLRVA